MHSGALCCSPLFRRRGCQCQVEGAVDRSYFPRALALLGAALALGSRSASPD
jgi:MYXO-CTERM domain-containing protein